jgi:hypothetical protein
MRGKEERASTQMSDVTFEVKYDSTAMKVNQYNMLELGLQSLNLTEWP